MKKLKRVVICILVYYILTIFQNPLLNAKTAYNPTSEFFVNDFASVLSTDVKNSVYQKAVEVYENTGAQIVVVTVPSLDGKDINTYANELFNDWEIGSSDKDNGVLFLIAVQDRMSRIEVGYGLEGALNDAKVGRMQDDLAIPYMKNDDYSSAVENIVTELQGIIYNEYGIEGGFDNYANVKDNSLKEAIITIIAFVIFFVIAIALAKKGIFIFGFPFGGGGGFHGGGFSGGGFSGGGGSSGGGGASRGF